MIPQAWIEYVRAALLRRLPDDLPPGMLAVIKAYRSTTPLKDTQSHDGVSSQQG